MAGLLGFDARSAIVIGVTLSISSTLVVVKILVERGELEATHGRALVGWMLVQDLVTIVVAATLPALAGGDPVEPLLLAVGRVALFLGLAHVAGTRLLPAAFRFVARLGSSELFLLAVIGTALVAAVASSALFGLGLALGAFVAGLVIAESDLSYQAVAEMATLRQVGVRRVSDPEVEAGVELARHALQRMGVSGPELAAIASGLRRSQYGPDPVPGGGRSD